jgi:plastocyanin
LKRSILSLVVALVALVALVVTASVSARSAAPPIKLTGTVGPGFTITLKKGTAKVSKLKPGKYSIQINDRSADHNFHLKGPGVNKMTQVPTTGKLKTPWLVTLKKGKYTYVCDPHALAMKGSFTVG